MGLFRTAVPLLLLSDTRPPAPRVSCLPFFTCLSLRSSFFSDFLALPRSLFLPLCRFPCSFLPCLPFSLSPSPCLSPFLFVGDRLCYFTSSMEQVLCFRPPRPLFPRSRGEWACPLHKQSPAGVGASLLLSAQQRTRASQRNTKPSRPGFLGKPCGAWDDCSNGPRVTGALP